MIEQHVTCQKGNKISSAGGNIVSQGVSDTSDFQPPVPERNPGTDLSEQRAKHSPPFPHPPISLAQLLVERPQHQLDGECPGGRGCAFYTFGPCCRVWLRTGQVVHATSLWNHSNDDWIVQHPVDVGDWQNRQWEAGGWLSLSGFIKMLGVMLMLFVYVKHTHILCLYMHKMEQQFLPKSRCEKTSFLYLYNKL